MNPEQVLDRNEMLCIADTEFLLTKQRAFKKLKSLFQETEKQLSLVIKDLDQHLPEGTLFKSGKLSKGENYMGLPYLMLDFPRLFESENTFAFRTMFWWGNFFSCTLQLSGQVLETNRNRIIEKIKSLQQMGIYLGISDDPWQYHLGDDNYRLLDNMSPAEFKQLILEKNTLKITRMLPLDEYMQLPAFASNSFQMYYQLLF